jgi:hypothetical protein
MVGHRGHGIPAGLACKKQKERKEGRDVVAAINNSVSRPYPSERSANISLLDGLDPYSQYIPSPAAVGLAL